MISLHRAGVREVIVSPGSRSTPFVLAARHAGLRAITIIDERSAGFFALGCARRTGIPPVLICTSGTAGAHYYPAVIEASQSHIPMLVITADRPPELHGCAAPQTIDQTRLYGSFARWFVDLGVADSRPSSLRAVARKAHQAAARSRGPIPGPVHINAPARKPLEPLDSGIPVSESEREVIERSESIGQNSQLPADSAQLRASDESIAALAEACHRAERGLIIAGPMPAAARVDPSAEGSHSLARAVRALARATGFPLLCEASSQLRFARITSEMAVEVASEAAVDIALIDGFDLLFAAPEFRRSVWPDVVIQLGAPPTSMSWSRRAADLSDAYWAVIAQHGWNDPNSAANAIIIGDIVASLARVTHQLDTRKRNDRSWWASGFERANELAWRCVSEVVPENPAAVDAAMREGEAIRAAISAVPPGARLTLGNGLPIRTVDTYCRSGRPHISVLSQRGANGIDGLLSGAAGTAWTRAGESNDSSGQSAAGDVVVLGDVSFAHDASSLAVCAGIEQSLVIVVIDNRGGRIFELLPLARTGNGTRAELLTEHWLTEPRCNIEALCAAHGVGYVRAQTAAELTAAVGDAGSASRCTVVHAVVAPSSASVDRQRLITALDRALADEANRDDQTTLGDFLTRGRQLRERRAAEGDGDRS